MIEEIIIQTLDNLSNSFEKNELAYLAITSKIELPIRDKWAYKLHQLLLSNYDVAREWKRTDLAIIKQQAPIVLIELKAMYTFDPVFKPEGINGYVEAMQNDAIKAKLLADSNTLIYTVLLATHPKKAFPITLDKVVKYLPSINKCLKTNDQYEGKIKMRAENIVADNLKHKNIVAKGVITGGEAFDTEVEVLYWIVKE
jgi:hypothetical protein